MSTVYLVDDLRLQGAQWAVKELDPGRVPTGELAGTMEMFRREGDILAKLNHPGMPKLIDSFLEPSGKAYLVMECVQGQTIQALLTSRARPLHPKEALPIALQAANVLQYLHSGNPPVIFRDLKPSNLILSPTGRVRFIDFGIARYLDPKSVKDTQELGTPGFCAPEQYHGHSTPQSDLYSLAVTLHYMLTLKDPQDLSFNFPALDTLCQVPAQFSEYLAECLSLEPDKRPKSAKDFAAELEQALHQLTVSPNSSTQSLDPALIALSKHAQLVPNLSAKGLGSFWLAWAKNMFGPLRLRRP